MVILYHVPRKLGFLARAWMRLVVNFGQMLPVEMGVNLCGTDAGVAEHLLDCAQIAGRLQHMGGKRVAQHVRVNRSEEHTSELSHQ